MFRRSHGSNGSAPRGSERRDEQERMRFGKTRLLLQSAASRSGLRTLMVVGCRPSTGVTTTAALFGLAMAEGNRHRVLLIDANFRTPTLDVVFDVSNSAGLFELLNGDTCVPAIHAAPQPNLWVLTAGRTPISPAPDLFDGKRIAQALTAVKQDFDFIILDCAPILDFLDAYAFSPEVDGVVLVLEAGRTPVRDAQQAKRDLELAGGHVIGAVLNRERDYTPRFLKRIFPRSLAVTSA